MPLDTTELEEASTAYIQQVSEAVAADEETAAYVDELESRAEEIDDEAELPSGDTLAAELTRFLREREQDGGEGSSRPRRAVARYPNVKAYAWTPGVNASVIRALRRLRAAAQRVEPVRADVDVFVGLPAIETVPCRGRRARGRRPRPGSAA